MRKTVSALTVAAAAMFLCPETAGAATVPAAIAAPAHAGWHHHWHPNCNNDPDWAFAMDPDVCPPSKNADAYRGDYDYPGDYGYGYPGRY